MNTLRNFFERMKEKFSGEEFHYAEKELMHFWGKVERTLEILEIWFGNFNSPNQDVTELKEYYDNMRGEFNQNVLENVDNLTNALYEMENYIFNHLKHCIMIRQVCSVHKAQVMYAGDKNLAV